MNTIPYIVLVLFLLPTSFVAAHERQAFQVGDKTYLFIVGSLDEPAVVDNKNAVSVRILEADPEDVGNSASPNAKPQEGLEKSLKAELGADGKTRQLDLSPAYKDPGHYTGLYFPTKVGVYTYRVIGTLNGISVDLPFTCMPGAHVMGGVPNTEPTKISEGVTRIFQSGMFGCPQEKSTLGFPIPSQTLAGMEEDTEIEIANIRKSMEADRSAAQGKFYVLLGLSILSLMLGLFAVVRLPGGSTIEVSK